MKKRFLLGIALSAVIVVNAQTWNIPGAAGALNTFIGTTTANDVNINAGGTTKMSIGSSGNVGIGIIPSATSPQLQIQVAGAKTTASSGILISNISTSSTASISKKGLEISSTGIWNGTNATNIGLHISAVGGGINNYDAIFNGGGNVGIGSSVPSAKLGVVAVQGKAAASFQDGRVTISSSRFGSGATEALSSLIVRHNIDGSGSSAALFSNSGTNSNRNSLYLTYQDGLKTDYLYGTSNDIAEFYVQNGGSSYFKGAMSIGGLPSLNPTNSPFKLFVRGGILTEKVKVAIAGTEDWPDYVFANDYKLENLSEVEKFIKTNKHLPNMPSAQEVVDKGLDLGKMDAKLLEKIEELTLYLIDLKKENEALKTRFEIIEKK